MKSPGVHWLYAYLERQGALVLSLALAVTLIAALLPGSALAAAGATAAGATAGLPEQGLTLTAESAAEDTFDSSQRNKDAALVNDASFEPAAKQAESMPGMEVQQAQEGAKVPETLATNLAQNDEQQTIRITPLQSISGNDFTFDASTGLLSISSNDGTTNWRGAGIQPSEVLQLDLSTNVSTISDDAFVACYNLVSVALPASLTTIGKRAFSDCGLSTVSFPASLREIDDDGFSSCNSLSSITIPGTLNTLGEAVFADCSQLTWASLAEGLSSTGVATFRGCNQLATVILPQTLTMIGNETFAGCRSLDSITLPAGLQQIGDSAFEQCGLTAIALPFGLKTIGNDVFYKNHELLSANIPAGVTSMGTGIFDSCYQLSSISLPTDLTHLPRRMFAGCAFASLDLSGCIALESLGEFVFLGCDFTQIRLPASLITIGESAFEKCHNLTSIAIPAGVTAIGIAAFDSCSLLTSIVLPDGLQIVEPATFVDCVSLASVSFPASITSLELGAFFGCSSLLELRFAGSAAPAFNTSQYGSFVGLPTGGKVYYPAGGTGYTAANFNTAADANQFSTWSFTGGTGPLPPPAPKIYPVLMHFGTFTGSGTLTAKIDADRGKFTRLVYNATGAVVDPANYAVGQGSTLITLSEAYLKACALGTHSFVAEYSDGKSEDIILTIGPAIAGNNPGDAGKLPATGDSLLPPLLVALLALAGATTLCAARKRGLARR